MIEVKKTRPAPLSSLNPSQCPGPPIIMVASPTAREFKRRKLATCKALLAIRLPDLALQSPNVAGKVRAKNAQ